MLKMRIQDNYKIISQNCAITTAASANFAVFLFNMLHSLHRNFPSHPKIYVFDIGLTKQENKELSRVPWLSVIRVPAFVPHWNLCFTWKPYVWSRPKERFILHLDAGLVVLRSLESWFLAIKKWGYLTFSQGCPVSDIAPSDFYQRFGLNNSGKDKFGFAAGIFGFDKLSPAGEAMGEALSLAKEGLSLGYSKNELYKVKNPLENIERDCRVFRHDQTLINLAFLKYYGHKILVRSNKHLPVFRPKKNKKSPFLWLSRTNIVSLRLAWRPLAGLSLAYVINRIKFIMQIFSIPISREYFKTA